MTTAGTTNGTPTEELELLRQRVLELEYMLAQHDQINEELYTARAMVDLSPDAIVKVVGPAIVYANIAACALFGYSATEFLNIPLPDIYTEEDRILLSGIVQHLAEYGIWQGVLNYSRKDGTTFPGEVSFHTIRDAKTGQFTDVNVGIIRDITLQRQREQALRKSELDNRAMLEAIPDLLFVLDSDGVYRDYKAERGSELLIPPEVFLGRTLEEVLPPDFAAWMRRLMADARATQAVQEFEYTLDLPDGKHWYEGRMVAGDDGQIMSLARDITARKQAEQQLRTFKMLADNAADGIGMANLEGAIIYGNGAYAEMTGFGDQWVGSTINDYLDPEAQHYFNQTVIPSVLSQGAWQGINTLRRPDGSFWKAQLSSFLLTDDSGAPSAIATIFRDITEQQQREHELHTFKILVERALDGISAATPDGTIIYANPAFHAMTGFGDSVMGMNFLALYPPEVQAQMLAESIPSLQREGKWHGQLQAQRPDGTRWTVQLNSFVITDPDTASQQFVAFFRDVTARQEQEQRLRTFEALVEHAPDAIGISGIDGIITYANAAQRVLYGYGDDTIGLDWRTFYPSDVKTQLDAMGEAMFEQGFWRGMLEQHDKYGRRFPIQLSAFMLRDTQGVPYAYASIIRDLTEQHHIEAERATLQEQVIAAQQAALRELSTPLIPIADCVVVMPLIGSIDSARAQQVIETLLTGVAENRATTVILDITGVPVVDTQVANALLRAAQAVKLLGAKVILTGIRPEVAQTLVGLGVDLSGIVTRGTLQSGVAQALGRL